MRTFAACPAYLSEQHLHHRDPPPERRDHEEVTGVIEVAEARTDVPERGGGRRERRDHVGSGGGDEEAASAEDDHCEEDEADHLPRHVVGEDPAPDTHGADEIRMEMLQNTERGLWLRLWEPKGGPRGRFWNVYFNESNEETSLDIRDIIKRYINCREKIRTSTSKSLIVDKNGGDMSSLGVADLAKG